MNGARQPQVKRRRPPGRYIATWAPIVVPTIVLLAALWLYRSVFNGDLSRSHDAWGQFGDFLGGVLNPVVGLITLILLIRTLELQRQELKEQRQEISNQNNILMRQAVEQTLFAWIKDYKAELSAFAFYEFDDDDEEPSRTWNGVEGLRRLIEACCTHHPHGVKPDVRDTLLKVAYATTPATPEELDVALAHCVERWEQDGGFDRDQLEGLIRTLYGLFKWIDQTSISALEKFEYASIVRGRLSTTELNMLFLNGMTEKGTNFIKYVHRYALFDNYSASSTGLLDEVRQAPSCRYRKRAYHSAQARRALQLADRIRQGGTPRPKMDVRHEQQSLRRK